MSEMKEKILRTALRLFAQEGYEAVSISRIAGALGLSKGALYRHYRDKRDVLDSIVREMERRDAEGAQEYALPGAEETEAMAARRTEENGAQETRAGGKSAGNTSGAREEEPSEGMGASAVLSGGLPGGAEFAAARDGEPSGGAEFPGAWEEEPSGGAEFPGAWEEEPSEGMGASAVLSGGLPGGAEFAAARDGEPSGGAGFPGTQEEEPSGSAGFSGAREEEPSGGEGFSGAREEEPSGGEGFSGAQREALTNGTESPAVTPRQLTEYARRMVRYWTRDEFAADFRRMLTLEQYRDPEMARMLRQYLTIGPMEYTALLLENMGVSHARERAAALCGGMYMLICAGDGAEDAAEYIALADAHLERMRRELERECAGIS